MAPKYLYKFYPEFINLNDKSSFFDFEDFPKVRFTQFNNLNDPFEMLPPNFDEIAPGFGKTIQGLASVNRGILCLSEDKRNLLMWAHYAHMHSGFAIEFDTENEFFRMQHDVFGNPIGSNPSATGVWRHEGVLLKVNYSDTRPEIVLSEMGSGFDTLLTSKSTHWAYEKEYRMMRKLHGHYGDDNRLCLFNLPGGAISKIILGVNASLGLEASAKNFCKRLNLPLEVAKLRSDTFNLNFSDVI